jgi:hypothetical protein
VEDQLDDALSKNAEIDDLDDFIDDDEDDLFDEIDEDPFVKFLFKRCDVMTKETQEHWYIWLRTPGNMHWAIKSVETQSIILELLIDTPEHGAFKVCPDLDIPLNSVRRQFPEIPKEEVCLEAPFVLRGQEHMKVSYYPEGSDGETCKFIILKLDPAQDTRCYQKLN